MFCQFPNHSLDYSLDFTIVITVLLFHAGIHTRNSANAHLHRSLAAAQLYSYRSAAAFRQSQLASSYHTATVTGTELCVSPTSLACRWKENKRILFVNHRHYRHANSDSELQSSATEKWCLQYGQFYFSLSANPPNPLNPLAVHFWRTWNSHIGPNYCTSSLSRS
jgi:hypothetical protein